MPRVVMLGSDVVAHPTKPEKSYLVVEEHTPGRIRRGLVVGTPDDLRAWAQQARYVTMGPEHFDNAPNTHL